MIQLLGNQFQSFLYRKSFQDNRLYKMTFLRVDGGLTLTICTFSTWNIYANSWGLLVFEPWHHFTKWRNFWQINLEKFYKDRTSDFAPRKITFSWIYTFETVFINGIFPVLFLLKNISHKLYNFATTGGHFAAAPEQRILANFRPTTHCRHKPVFVFFFGANFNWSVNKM